MRNEYGKTFRLTDNSFNPFKYIIWIIAFIIVIITLSVFFSVVVGVGGMGPRNTDVIKITRVYVDSGSKESGSHYMVASDKGIFEVANGVLLHVFNADELFGKLKDGHSYKIVTKGRKVVNFFMQEYPYIVEVEEVSAEK